MTTNGTRVLVLGYIGRRNMGDDAICLSLIQTIKKLRLFQKATLYIYSNERYLCKYLENVDASVRAVSSAVSVGKAFLCSNTIAVVGGDQLNDYGSSASSLKVFLFFFALGLISKFLHKKFNFVNAGFGVSTNVTSTLLSMILKLSSSVSVRDSRSYDLASKYSTKQLTKGFDTAVLLNSTFEKKVVQPANSPPELKVGLSITPVFANYFSDPKKDYSMAKTFATEITGILETMGNVIIYLLAFNSDAKVGDLGIINTIFRLVDPSVQPRVKVIAYEGDINQFICGFSSFDAMVCCKYHSILFSYLLQKPMVVINYHPKNTALVKEIKLDPDCLLSVDDVSNGKLCSTLGACLNAQKDCRCKLSLTDAREGALAGVKQLCEALR